MLLDVETVARELHAGQSTIRRAIREGRLPAVRIGRRVLIRRDALEGFVKDEEQRAMAARKET
jgi:excisionase family DNA binding protein